jgi:hypothetical protein
MAILLGVVGGFLIGWTVSTVATVRGWNPQIKKGG